MSFPTFLLSDYLVAIDNLTVRICRTNCEKDISMAGRYTDICGVSKTDLRGYFTGSVKELADANNLSEGECYRKLSLMYDGYHFCEDSIGIYNLYPSY